MVFKIVNQDIIEKYIDDFILFSKDIAPAELQYWGKEHFMSNVEGKWEYSVACFENEVLLAYIICTKKGISHIHINKMAVNNSYRNMGVGHKLIEYFERNAFDKGVNLISLYTNVINNNAKKFYENNGYTIENLIDNSELDRRYYMIKKL